jgi:8-oxo-dGTP pyrophosphatase MutT (NUDIX family)
MNIEVVDIFTMEKDHSLKTEKHVSSGGLVYRHRDDRLIEVVLISRLGGKVWCLPKGHVEEGESFEQAAQREVREETGVEAQVVTELGEVQYWYYDRWAKKRIFKTVHFFLLNYLKGDVQNHDREVDEACWFSIDQALTLLTYSSEREIFQKALKSLNELQKN